MHGRRSPQWVERFLGRVDASVLVSDYEGTSITMLESMGAGVVPVVTRVSSGVDEWIRDGENGWLCRDRDPADLATAILRSLDAPDEPTSTEACHTAEAHDWSRVAERYLEIFRSVSRD